MDEALTQQARADRWTEGPPPGRPAVDLMGGRKRSSAVVVQEEVVEDGPEPARMVVSIFGR